MATKTALGKTIGKLKAVVSSCRVNQLLTTSITILQLVLLSNCCVLASNFHRITTTWQAVHVNRTFISTTFLQNNSFTCTKSDNVNFLNYTIFNTGGCKQNIAFHGCANVTFSKMTRSGSGVINGWQQHTQGNKEREEKFFHDHFCFVVKKFVATKQPINQGAGVSAPPKLCIKIVSA